MTRPRLSPTLERVDRTLRSNERRRRDMSLTDGLVAPSGSIVRR